MKKKYTLTVANSQIDIITDENKETIDTIVSVVDRKIREVYLHSKGECSRTNAAILVCLDYCAEKMELQKTLRNINTEIERLEAALALAEKEKASLEREIETLRMSLNSASSQKIVTKKAPAEQIVFDEITEEISVPEAEEEILTPPSEAEVEKPHVKLKKKKVRAMFDNIAFDDI